MQCFDAFKDAHGNPGQHKEPLTGFDTPMLKNWLANTVMPFVTTLWKSIWALASGICETRGHLPEPSPKNR